MELLFLEWFALCDDFLSLSGVMHAMVARAMMTTLNHLPRH